VGINYWGRIPKTLKAQGAAIYYGKTDGWGSIETNAAILKTTIEKVLAQTKAAKVNIIAHSKGGLEARYMICNLGMAGKVASLTTIATPHHGSVAAKELLGLRDWFYRLLAIPANAIRFLFGDKHPDFYNGTKSLTTDYMKDFNKKNPDRSGIYYQSFAGGMKAPSSDIILVWPSAKIRSSEGENDGAVSVASAKWTNFRGVLRGAGYRGVSHLDEVDFRRRDVKIQPLLGAATVREFYVALVADLKQSGY
jgi:triacylglycerol lipase